METDADTRPLASSLSLPGPHRLFGWRRAAASCWPAAVVTLGFLVLLGSVLHRIKASEGGRFVYTIDDGYFHLAVAKNVLRHGLWGISALDGFSSGTSSLLWPLIIAASFALFGIHEYLPLVLNVLAGIALVFYAGSLVRRTTGSNFLALGVLAAVVVLMPFLAVTSTGMEHCLQALLALVFVDLAARLLTGDAQRLTSRGAQWALCGVAILLVMTRYEGLFLVAPVGLLLLCQRRWLLAVSLGVCALLPITLFGFWAMSKGWFFLPNSLLMKGNTKVVLTAAGLLDYFSKWYTAAVAERHMLALLAAVTLALVGSLQRRRTLWTYPTVFLFITLLATIQHLQLAGIGWFYRYEAYLVALSLVGLGVAWGYERTAEDERYWRSVHALPYYGALVVAAILFGTPLWVRAVNSYHHVPTASYNIYEQQYQMGHFVRRYYAGKGVAANDVGAISFFGEISILDVVGLSDADVLRARLKQTLDQGTIRRLSKQHHVELAVIYDSWSDLYGGPLPEWVRVGQWQIVDNTVVGSDIVSFYATHREGVTLLARQLREFGATMPRSVVQTGLYCEAHPLEASGTYGPEGDPHFPIFWTGKTARFNVYPTDGEPLGADTTTLRLSALAVGPGQTVDVFFNDELVATQPLLAQMPIIGWTSFDVRAKWRAGVNLLRLEGHGTPVVPPGDSRPFLFRVLDPRAVIDDAGQVVPRPPYKSAAP